MVLMIICVCNALNCKSVRAAVEAGADSPKAVQAHHGCRFQCGKCRSSIGEMIAETDIDRGPAPALMAAE
ncbi:(2Fe-2S)-binding protein [Hyphomonas jannaschiana]|uniref:Bacterioferritin-associated ferredoxin n=1 Tax=Hyphomonas jannaschiana VP2 TaxID=1280952 RepID=A0A059FEE7_9PROT|nr:(2Fe-2S)-binding protein [Hyphomonas jannaschiana]KCZ89005.1 BFD/(2Fe-2S)-binding domain-containing protein [Hyphomonas jannaschiana VP2]